MLAELKGEMQLHKNSRRPQHSTLSRMTRQKVKDTEDSSRTAGQVELASVRRAPRLAAAQHTARRRTRTTLQGRPQARPQGEL